MCVLWIPPTVLAEHDAGHRDVFDQDDVGCNLRDFARSETDHEHAPLPADAPHTLPEYLPANGIEHDIDTLALGQVAHAITQIFASVVDDIIGAVLAGNGKLIRRASSRNDACAKEFANFDSRQAHTTRGAENEQHLTGQETASVHQRKMSCAVGHWKGGGDNEVHGSGDRGDDCVGHHDLLCMAATPACKSEHTIPRPHTVYPLGAFENNTCDLQARNEWELWFDLVFSLHH